MDVKSVPLFVLVLYGVAFAREGGGGGGGDGSIAVVYYAFL